MVGNSSQLARGGISFTRDNDPRGWNGVEKRGWRRKRKKCRELGLKEVWIRQVKRRVKQVEKKRMMLLDPIRAVRLKQSRKSEESCRES